MKIIVITTIYKPSSALLKYLTFKDWTTLVVGDKKTPEEDYIELEKQHPNLKYLSVHYQEENHKEISDTIGWNTIQRRNIGFLEALKLGATCVASVDDDNIPFDNWGQNILIGKPSDVYFYQTDNSAFDPVNATNYKNLWHRGFPIQNLKTRDINIQITKKIIIPDIQADFWNGDPDIDAFCRLEHGPQCFFDDKYFPIATNTFSPFNSQNTFFSREALKKYLVIPFIGRMDDIWASYYIESLGFKVVYNKASVFQDRNIQNLTKNLENEFLGYTYTLNLLEELKKDSANLFQFIPPDSKKVIELYQHITSQLD